MAPFRKHPLTWTDTRFYGEPPTINQNISGLLPVPRLP